MPSLPGAASGGVANPARPSKPGAHTQAPGAASQRARGAAHAAAHARASQPTPVYGGSQTQLRVRASHTP